MDKKKEILQAMFVLFSQKGYQASMADLAEEVNLKPSSLYSHFGSKDEIVYLAVEGEVNQFFNWMDDTIKKEKDTGPEDTLKKMQVASLAYFRKMNRLRFWKNIVLIQDDQLRERCQKLIRQRETAHLQFVAGLFDTMVAEGKLCQDRSRGAMNLYLCMGNGLLDIMLANQEASFDFDTFAEDAWQFYQRALQL